MNLPETCPFCGSGSELKHAENWVGYTCITTIHAGHDARRMQSATCAGLERTRLIARVAELEARCKRLEEAGDDMLEALYTPEPPRCMCYRSYPCDDCVNYSSARDAKQKWQQAKEAKP